jgi:AraC-like DNA-binding protein
MKNRQETQKVKSVQLRVEGKRVSFLLRTMEEISAGSRDEDPVPHRHDYYTIIWVREGTGKHLIDFKQYTVSPDTIYFITPEQVHHLTMNTPHSGFVLLFTTDFIEQNDLGTDWIDQSGFFFRCDEVAPLAVSHYPYRSRMLLLIRAIQEECNRRDALSDQAAASLLRLFLLECKRAAELAPPENAPKPAGRNQLVKQFKDLLEKKYREWHKVAEYAKELHISPNYLNEVVSLETGQSAKEMILNRVILEAKRFATHAENSAKEVAFVLGFDDPAHFSKIFKQYTSGSFTQFREDFRKKYK